MAAAVCATTVSSPLKCVHSDKDPYCEVKRTGKTLIFSKNNNILADNLASDDAGKLDRMTE